MTSHRPGWIEVDLDALTHNWTVLRSVVGPGINIIPALKGNTYGHGVELLTAHLAKLEPYKLRVSINCKRPKSVWWSQLSDGNVND